MTTPAEKACLIVIDGWGVSENADATGDAIRNASTPVMTDLAARYPSTTLAAHGLAVGLPDGLMGNSEVGHLNVGAGRIVYQDIVRIDLSIQTKTLGDQPALVAAFDRAKKGNGRLHLLGLVSDGGVHSHIVHLFNILDAAKKHKVPSTYIHFFGDGRDTAPRSSATYMEQLLAHTKSIGYGSVATATGRYYAMDRDKRWERIKIAFDGLVQGKGEETSDIVATIHERYAKDETDEFLKPIIANKDGLVGDNDTLVFFNYRSDRMREITQAFGIAPIPFETEKAPLNISITTMTQYKGDYPFPVIFAPQTMDNVLAEWISKKGIRQNHIAETEKYAHVTFFFNGGSEKQNVHEDRELIASPKVATYDLQPEMSASGVAEKVAEVIATNNYPFVMCNFAPPDMVGHTGKYEPAIKGVEATDKGIGVIYEACKKHGYVLFITADHGNAEKMLAENGQPHTAHTCNPVPFIMTSTRHNFALRSDAALCDVAPTILEVMGLDIPAEMSGKSLLAK
ncbi:2,3-bisphosphoglycerate-independent phosphoglycerate mutase [Polychytrium aggregatum]|uniref:2,3-bisphosphoglycerate-independent phosphoglycerate mutase n=1 Tax=Polychytrium aggregatum TaxID=110093 RepID=UPI0022FDB8CD|nr:2,3-bisphosphoglycerate-independent phosphoglycerate mutase [Polychytrium aggregatum]KAI9193285.1 2,3-bisphosphoglycerate-independent phosphoglycerate mutase [Polychytrium aggregatum]